MKKIWNGVTTTVLVLMAIITVMLVGVRITGLQVFSVLSGSMEPTYPTGSLIYVRKTDSTQLGEGQAITYLVDEKTVVTHRIVEVIKSGNDCQNNRYRTKGDANDVVDGTLVHNRNVIGIPVCSIPYMGYLANFIEKPMGRSILVVFAGLLAISVISKELAGSDKKQKEKKVEGQPGKTAIS